MQADSTANRRPRRLNPGLAAAALCVVSLKAFASASIDRDDCPADTLDQLHAVAVAGPSLQGEPVDRSRITSVPAATGAPPAVDESATLAPTAVPAMPASSLLDELLDSDDAVDDEVEDAEEQRPELPPTATRLPGVADEDLPRFRRQMFRQDI